METCLHMGGLVRLSCRSERVDGVMNNFEGAVFLATHV